MMAYKHSRSCYHLRGQQQQAEHQKLYAAAMSTPQGVMSQPMVGLLSCTDKSCPKTWKICPAEPPKHELQTVS